MSRNNRLCHEACRRAWRRSAPHQPRKQSNKKANTCWLTASSLRNTTIPGDRPMPFCTGSRLNQLRDLTGAIYPPGFGSMNQLKPPANPCLLDRPKAPVKSDCYGGKVRLYVRELLLHNPGKAAIILVRPPGKPRRKISVDFADHFGDKSNAKAGDLGRAPPRSCHPILWTGPRCEDSQVSQEFSTIKR